MHRSTAARIAFVSAVFALHAPVVADAAAVQAPSGGQPAGELSQQAETGKYSGLRPLIRAHRDEQVKMVKLWQAMKSGSVDEKTREAYKEAQVRTQQASNKVTRFIAEERWTDADRAAMTKMWTDELEKPIE